MFFLAAIIPIGTLTALLVIQVQVRQHPDGRISYLNHARRGKYWSWAAVGLTSLGVIGSWTFGYRWSLSDVSWPIAFGLTGWIYAWHESRLKSVDD